MIWNLLQADGIFDTLPASKATLVQDKFEQKIKLISMQITAADTLIILDKRVISEMLQDLKEPLTPTPAPAPVPIPLPNYSAADLSQTRQKLFQAELTNKQKEFDTLNNVPVPSKIDFSDQLDTPIGSEMDKIVAQQIALREKQLAQVLQGQDKAAANKWFGEEPVKLKIGESIKPIEKTKKVAFADDPIADAFAEPIAEPIAFDTIAIADDETDFLTQLKKKENDIPSLLREILAKQNQILDLLHKDKM